MSISRALCALLLTAAVGGCAPSSPAAAEPATCPTDLPAGGEAPLLPADHAIGPAFAIYRTLHDLKPGSYNDHGPVWLSTMDGSRYTLPRAPIKPLPEASTSPLLVPPEAPRETTWDPLPAASLSPDGHWLATNDPGAGPLLRELTSTRVIRVTGGTGEISWSPRSRWAAVRGSAGGSWVLADLAGGSSRVIEVPPGVPGYHLVGVQDDGQLIFTAQYDMEDPDPDPQHETFYWLDRAGKPARKAALDIEDAMPAWLLADNLILLAHRQFTLFDLAENRPIRTLGLDRGSHPSGVVGDELITLDQGLEVYRWSPRTDARTRICGLPAKAEVGALASPSAGQRVGFRS